VRYMCGYEPVTFEGRNRVKFICPVEGVRRSSNNLQQSSDPVAVREIQKIAEDSGSYRMQRKFW
jgi:hypothetical protein